MCFDEPMTNT